MRGSARTAVLGYIGLYHDTARRRSPTDHTSPVNFDTAPGL